MWLQIFFCKHPRGRVPLVAGWSLAVPVLRVAILTPLLTRASSQPLRPGPWTAEFGALRPPHSGPVVSCPPAKPERPGASGSPVLGLAQPALRGRGEPGERAVGRSGVAAWTLSPSPTEEQQGPCLHPAARLDSPWRATKSRFQKSRSRWQPRVLIGELTHMGTCQSQPKSLWDRETRAPTCTAQTNLNCGTDVGKGTDLL